MPIFTYVAVVSSALIALLFIMDVMLEKGAPPICIGSGCQSLGRPWRSLVTKARAIHLGERAK